MPRRLGALTFLLLGLLGLPAGRPAFGQVDSLGGLSTTFARYAKRMPAEKLFLHLDRPSYVSGETMWCKIYAVDGGSHQLLTASTVAYVEVLDQNQRPVAQGKVALRQATGQGSFVLPAALASGQYTVRAYTSWMKNFGPDLYFQSPVTILNTRTPLGLPASPPVLTYDPQFFPEGGYLVQGLPSKVGFKITDSYGRSVAAEGTVQDQEGVKVASFRTLRFGLGSFSFTPVRAGAGYTAVIRLADQKTITCALPVVREHGYVLRLTNDAPDQLHLVVQTSGAALASGQVYLLAHTRQQPVVAATTQLYQGQAVFTIPKQKLADGITHFTIFNAQRQPVAERLYFRPPTASLPLTARTDKSQYAPRQKVALQLSSGAAPGTPVANVSVAVYQLDSLSAGAGATMAGYVWLTSDVKGPVESPEYYLAAPDKDTVAAATDNLMLTQGWSRFRWAEVLADQPRPVAYLPELNGHLVRGRLVHRLTGAAAPNIPVYLTTPSRSIQLYTSVSQPDGSLQFEPANFYGTKQLIAQPNTAQDSVYRVELLNPFSEQYATGRFARFSLSEEGLRASMQRRHVQAQVQQAYSGRRPVVYRTPPADSTAFYGKPSEKYMLDAYTRFKVMEEVMREYVPGVLVRIRKDGFHFLVPDNNSRSMLENPLVLLDGMPVFNTNRIMAFDPLKVQKLEVVTKRYFLGPLMHSGIVSYTTYQGDLAGFPLDPHALLQEYEGLQGQREFYAPRYETAQQQQSRLPDFRNLLYWNPQVLLTPGGASPELSFYTSDQVGLYRVVVQGMTAAGLIGTSSFTFEVKAAL